MVAATFFALALTCTDTNVNWKIAAGIFRVVFDNRVLRGIATVLATNLAESERIQRLGSIGRVAVIAMSIYSMVVYGALVAVIYEEISQ